jgi:hypothetical protein
LKPGDPLSPTAERETQRKLYDLGVFARVDTAIQNPDGDTGEKYVLYDMEEARKYSIATGFGAEFARIGGCSNCLEAPQGQTGFAPDATLDVSRLNLWGLGQSLSFRGRVSTLEQRALVNYTAPRVGGNEKLTLSFTTLYDNSKDVRTFTAQRFESSVQLSERLSKSITFLYRYTYRHVTVDQSTLKISPYLIPLFSQPDRVGEVSWSMVQDRRDDPIDTHKGIYNTLDISAAPRAFGSEITFGRFLGRNATYHPIGKKLVLARATSFGIVRPLHNASDANTVIPLPEHFFSGGATSERGFPDLQAGPRDTTTGFPLGGTALLMNQTELRFPLLGENIRRSAFSRHGQRLQQPVEHLVPHGSTWEFRFRLHEPRGGLRDTLSHADRSGAAGPGIQHQSAALHRLQGKLQRLAERRPVPLHDPALQLRGAEHQPLPILLFDRADILMRRRFSIAILLAGPMDSFLGAEIIDRIAVSVGNRVITETDLDREIRITAFLNNAKPDFSPANKRETAERMVDQALVRNELEASRYPPPSAADTEAALQGGEGALRRRCRVPPALARVRHRRRRSEGPVDVATDAGALHRRALPARHPDRRCEIQKYFDEHMRAGLMQAHPGQTPSVDDYREGIEQTLIGQAADQQVEQWLKEARRRTHIQYHDEVFQ